MSLASNAGATRLIAKSGDEGRFEFREVAAGTYFIAADTGEHRPTHLTQQVDSSGPGRRVDPLLQPQTIEIKDGEVRQDVVLALARAFVVTGVVLNDHGEPMANIDVRAELIRAGRVFRRSGARSTDDNGAFRVFGLPPGRYRVCAHPPPPYFMQAAERLVTTCYPSVSRAQDAGLVVLGGADEAHVQIRMIQARTYTLSGTVLDSSGLPAPGAHVEVSVRDSLDVFGIGQAVGPEGRFKVSGLVAGDYSLIASMPGSARSTERKVEFAVDSVRVDGADLDVVLSMRKTTRVSGHVVFEDGTVPPKPEWQKIRVMAVPTIPGAPQPAAATVREDFSFEIDGLFGPQLFDPRAVPDGWVLKSVRYGGADVTDVPTEFSSAGDRRALQISLTTRTAAVEGRVVDGVGTPVAGAAVALFPAEPGRWGGHAGEMAETDERGSFRLDGVRAGEYLIVAVKAEDRLDLHDRDDYVLIAKIAERITLREGDRRAISIRAASLPEDP